MLTGHRHNATGEPVDCYCVQKTHRSVSLRTPPPAFPFPRTTMSNSLETEASYPFRSAQIAARNVQDVSSGDPGSFKRAAYLAIRLSEVNRVFAGPLQWSVFRGKPRFASGPAGLPAPPFGRAWRPAASPWAGLLVGRIFGRKRLCAARLQTLDAGRRSKNASLASIVEESADSRSNHAIPSCPAHITLPDRWLHKHCSALQTISASRSKGRVTLARSSVRGSISPSRYRRA